MKNRIWLMIVVVLGIGCTTSDDKSKTNANDDAGASDAGGDASTEEPLDFSKPEGKMALRKRLLGKSDNYTFDKLPETISDDCDVTLEAKGSGDADALIEAVEAADSFTVICLKPGGYAMDKSIVISSAANLTIKGLGKKPSDTTLDFAGHTGDKGFDVTTPGFWIENLAVKNTIGNGVEVKAEGTPDNPTVYRKLKVSWDVPAGAALDCSEADPRRKHGAYSVYPTKSSYVVVEFCEVEGASDAGLYIGQVQHGKVRHNKVHGNVAGLEVENSLDVIVYDNEVYENAGGILALQEPGLVRLANETVLIRNNVVHENNGCNFAKPNTAVANVPQGTGLMCFSGHDIEFRDNNVTGNDTTGLLIVSNVLLNLLGGKEPDFPEGYDPYAHDVFVNGNTFTGNATKMAKGDAGKVGGAAGGFKDVSWDGFRSDATPTAEAARICLGDSKATFVDITQDKCEMPESETAFAICVNTNKSNDTAAHKCKGSVTFTDF